MPGPQLPAAGPWSPFPPRDLCWPPHAVFSLSLPLKGLRLMAFLSLQES